VNKTVSLEKKGNWIEIPYGKGKLSIPLPKGWEVDVFRPKPISPAQNPISEVLQSLEHPLGNRRLQDFSGIKSAGIAISDETRPVPNHLILPVFLERLRAIGIPNSAIQIIIASGLHSPTPESRFLNLLPREIIHDYKIVAHDANSPDLLLLGKTSHGNPVFVNPLFFKADLRVAMGMIDPHQFVGYTGGVKCAAIGLAGAQTIEANHSMLFKPGAVIGEIQNNPVRQDIEEIGNLMGVHFVINVILDETNQIIKAFSGDPILVESAGSEFCRKVYEITTSEEYDVVIASPGGYPKDINVYQAQKALAHAIPLVRKGGKIILVAECPEGHGDDIFYQTMKQFHTPQEVVERFQREKFRMGVHKAFLWTRSMIKAKVYLYSSLKDELCHELMTIPIKQFEDLSSWLETKHPSPLRIAVMPKANSTYARVLKT
jgi:nickel-dependent lactate racemase